MVNSQAPPAMGFSRQEYWSGLPFPPPGYFSHPRIESTSLRYPAFAGGIFTTSTNREALKKSKWVKVNLKTVCYSLTDDAVKVLHSIGQQIWKTQQWPQDWKRSLFIPIPKKGNANKCSNYHTIALISQASKVMLKILQARLQQYVNRELPDVQAGFRKGRGNRSNCQHVGSSKKQENSRKISTSSLLTTPKPLTLWITTNCGKFFKRWEYQTTWPSSWEICMQVKKKQLELDME